jgi:hypothetical protein
MFLTITGGKLMAADEPTGTPVEVTTAAELAAVTATTDGVWCSSSIDFPEEHTSDPNVLALVKLLHEANRG